MRRVRRELAGPWVVVFGVGVLITAANAYYIVPASVLSVLMDRLSVGPASASLLVSVIFGAQVVFGVPVGIALDRVDNRRAILVATLALLVVYAWSWRAAAGGDYWSVVISRGVAAPATAVVWTAGVNLIGRVFPAERQATAVGVFSGCAPAGFALGLLTGPLVTERFGWTAIFVAYAVPAVVGCAVFWFASARVDVSGGDVETPRLADFGRLLTDRPVWNVALMAFLGSSVYTFVTSWVPTYLTDELGVPLARAGLFVALFPAIGAVARGGSGAVSDYLFDHRRRPVALLSFVVSAPAVLLLAVADTVAVVFLALLLSGAFVQLGVGLFYVLTRELADPNVAATGVAFATTMATFAGFVAPLVAGFLIGRGGYPAAFGYAVVTPVVGVVLAWYTPEPGV